jgi:hypothetical protein
MNTAVRTFPPCLQSTATWKHSLAIEALSNLCGVPLKAHRKEAKNAKNLNDHGQS